MKPGLYNMIRTTDQTGVSGTGRVAQMAVFEDGTATVRWMTGKDSTVNWAKFQDALDVHINCHPDTTKLVPVDGDVCEHGLNTFEEYCDPCAEAAVARQDELNAKCAAELSKSDEWAAIRETTKSVDKTITDWCERRGLRYESHDSHGLYFDVWVRGQRFMLDCSPEDATEGDSRTSEAHLGFARHPGLEP